MDLLATLSGIDLRQPASLRAAKAAEIKAISHAVGLVFDITPPAMNVAKKSHVEFLVQCLVAQDQLQPAWARPEQPDELYTELARACGVDLYKIDLGHIRCESFFYQNHKCLGVFKKLGPQQFIRLQLEPSDLQLLRDKECARVVCYALDVQLKPLREMSDAACNGLDLAPGPFPIELEGVQEGNLVHVGNPAASYLAFFIAKSLTPEQQFAQLLKKPLITCRRMKGILEREKSMKSFELIAVSTNDNEDEDDEDVTVDTETISLISPISIKKVCLPVRSSLCRHFNEVMDLEDLLRHVRTGGAWVCQVCRQPCDPSQLHVDAFIYFCLRAGAGRSVALRGDTVQLGPAEEPAQEKAGSEDEFGWDL